MSAASATGVQLSWLVQVTARIVAWPLFHSDDLCSGAMVVPLINEAGASEFSWMPCVHCHQGLPALALIEH